MNASGKWLMIGIVLVAGIGGGVLLLRNTNPRSQIPKPKTETVSEPTAVPEVVATAGTAEAKTFVVEGSSFKFVPTVIKVKKGDNVQITFKNSGGTHDFVIDEFGVKSNQIGEGEEEDVEFVADKIGTFEYYCSVGNHRKMGMAGKLMVE